jgi:hypothetical protein
MASQSPAMATAVISGIPAATNSATKPASRTPRPPTLTGSMLASQTTGNSAA